MPTFAETVPKLLGDPLWADQPFWLLNFFRLKRDATGDTTRALESFHRYLSSAQRYAGQDTGRQTWFRGARPKVRGPVLGAEPEREAAAGSR